MPFDRYFDERSQKFSSFYGNERVTRLLGRGALFDRLRFAVQTAIEIDAKHVLDIGCGSGPLFEPLATKGIRVTGIEPAHQMVELAQREAARFPDLVEVREAGWESLDAHDAYDMAAALGIFDYVEAADELLSRLAAAAPSVVASFPRPGPRTNFRKVRYGMNGVRVFGYDRARVESLGRGAGMEVANLEVLGRAGYVVHFSRPRAGTG
jgi:SAM-dependent methyltransferase